MDRNEMIVICTISISIGVCVLCAIICDFIVSWKDKKR